MEVLGIRVLLKRISKVWSTEIEHAKKEKQAYMTFLPPKSDEDEQIYTMKRIKLN